MKFLYLKNIIISYYVSIPNNIPNTTPKDSNISAIAVANRNILTKV